jgi:ABC-type branched-subunit amino acid transport system substrate-binding protein
MTRPTPAWRTAVVLATASFALAACGSSGSDEKSSSESSGSSSPSAVPKGDGTLTIGTLLPQTGDLSFLGPPEIAGVDLAVKEINDAGGINGKKIVQTKSDSGDGTPDIAGASVDKLLANNADVIVGAASSNVSKSVIDKITGEGVVQFSPANTAAGFDTYPDKGLYFRTAPSDVLQGKVVANQAVKDGFKNVAVLARQDFYGEGLAASAVKNLKAAGVNVTKSVLYNADAENFTAEVNEIAASKPDAIILVAFNETVKIVPALISKSIGPQDVQLYFVDGNLADYSKDFPAGTLDGAKGTQPGVVADKSFQDRMKSVDPKLTVYNYGPESYDATVLSALAAEAAKSDAGTAIAGKLEEVSKGGTKCTTFTDCKKLLDAGTDIDYDGVSGPVEFSDKGDPTEATIGIYQYGPDNTYKYLDGKSGKL